MEIPQVFSRIQYAFAKESKTACGTGDDKYEALYYKREVLYCKDPYRSAVVIFTVGLVTPSIEERKCCTEALVLRVLAAITSELQTTREIANAGAGVRGTPTLAVLLELLVLLKLNRLTDTDMSAAESACPKNLPGSPAR